VGCNEERSTEISEYVLSTSTQPARAICSLFDGVELSVGEAAAVGDRCCVGVEQADGGVSSRSK
jgi:hypothetical protein